VICSNACTSGSSPRLPTNLETKNETHRSDEHPNGTGRKPPKKKQRPATRPFPPPHSPRLAPWPRPGPPRPPAGAGPSNFFLLTPLPPEGSRLPRATYASHKAPLSRLASPRPLLLHDVSRWATRTIPHTAHKQTPAARPHHPKRRSRRGHETSPPTSCDKAAGATGGVSPLSIVREGRAPLHSTRKALGSSSGIARRKPPRSMAGVCSKNVESN